MPNPTTPAVRTVAEWAGTTDDRLDLHRFTADKRARCNPDIRTYSRNTTPERDRSREPYARLRTREEIEADPLVAAGRVAYRFCPDCATEESRTMVRPTTPDVLALYTAVESGEEAGDRAAFLDALDARDAAVRTAAIREAADWLVRKYGVTNRAAGDLYRLASAPAAAAPTPKEG